MFDPRRPLSEQYPVEWKAVDELNQAVAVAHLALTMARDSADRSPTTSNSESSEKPDVLALASKQLENAHLLLRRAYKVANNTPLDEIEIPPVSYYTYNVLCSGLTKDMMVGKYSWKPLASEGSAFRNLLREYAKESVERHLHKHRDSLEYQLCEIKVSFDDGGEDQRGWLIYCISNDEVVRDPHLNHDEACYLVNSACKRIPKSGKRTSEWAQKMIADGEAKIADQRYKTWMSESKAKGLPEKMVTALIYLRKRKDDAKGRRKDRAGVSE